MLFSKDLKKSFFPTWKVIPCILSFVFVLIFSGLFFSPVSAMDDDLFDIDAEVAALIDGDEELEQGFRVTDELIRLSPDEDIAELSFWGKTHGARSRDPLFLVPHRRLMFDKTGLSGHIFFNMSNRLPISPNSVLSIEALDLLSKFSELSTTFGVDEIGDFGTLFKTLPYVRKMTAQERRIGMFLSGGLSKKRYSIQIEQPILLGERNYWLEDKKDRQALQDIINDLDGVSKSSVYTVVLGLGDTKLRLGYNPVNNDYIKMSVGAEGIIPTSRLFYQKPNNSLETVPGAERNALLTDLLNVGRNILIEPDLGVGHWGLGLFFELKTQIIPKRVDFWGRFVFDYLFKGDQYRFMPSRQKVSFDALEDLALDTEIPEDFPVNDLFPYMVKTSVTPGHFFNVTTGLDVKLYKNWMLGFGYDFYLQGSEKIIKVRDNTIDESLLVLEDVTDARVLQHRVFGDLSYTHKGKRRDWMFGVGGDMTFAHEGSNRDWTVHGKIGITF